MPETSPLMELHERKQLLVQQAELHRAVLELESANVKARLSGLNQARHRLSAGPWVWVGSALAGVVALRKWRTVLRWAPAILSGLRLVRRFIPR